MKLSFSIKQPKVVRHKVENRSKLLRGLVVLEEDTYKVYVKLDDSTNLVLPFTDKSYNLKGKTKVFSKSKGPHGHEMYIRSEWKARISPGLNTQYVPFIPDWIVSGWIVQISGKKYFDFNDIICHKNYEDVKEHEQD